MKWVWRGSVVTLVVIVISAILNAGDEKGRFLTISMPSGNGEVAVYCVGDEIFYLAVTAPEMENVDILQATEKKACDKETLLANLARDFPDAPFLSSEFVSHSDPSEGWVVSEENGELIVSSCASSMLVRLGEIDDPRDNPSREPELGSEKCTATTTI